MKRPFLASVAAVSLVLALAGCAAPQPVPTPTVTVTVTATPEPAPTVTVTATPEAQPGTESESQTDLTTDAGLCAADAEMTSLELNDALAPILGFPADRDARSFEDDEAIREHKNAAFERECPARAG